MVPGGVVSGWKRGVRQTLQKNAKSTYYMACFQVKPSRLLTAAAVKCTYRKILRYARLRLTDAEDQRRKPERVDRICSWAGGVVVRELQTGGGDRGEEGRNGRQVQQVFRGMCLRKSNRRDTLNIRVRRQKLDSTM